MNLNTIFLGIIAAVALGAAVVWWSDQPSAEERRRAETEQAMQRLQTAVDDYQEIDQQLRSLDGN